MMPAMTEQTTRVVYETVVTAVGEKVEDCVKAGMLILFADGAPDELHPISVLHRPSVRQEGPRAGDTLRLGSRDIPVLAVGEVVEANLLNLGHVDFKADGRTEAKLPGDVCVPSGSLATVRVGDVVRIVRADSSDTREENPV